MTTAEGQWVTTAFLLIVTAVIVGFDVVIVNWAGVDASISRVLRYTFDRYPTAAVAFYVWIGILIGHIGLSNFPK